MQEVKEASVRIMEIDQEVLDLEQRINRALLMIPNIPHESVPVGSDESANVVVRAGGRAAQFDFEPRKPTGRSGRRSGILDFERGAKIAGARFTCSRAGGAAGAGAHQLHAGPAHPASTATRRSSRRSW